MRKTFALDACALIAFLNDEGTIQLGLHAPCASTIFPRMTDDNVEEVIEDIREVLEKKK